MDQEFEHPFFDNPLSSSQRFENLDGQTFPKKPEGLSSGIISSKAAEQLYDQSLITANDSNCQTDVIVAIDGTPAIRGKELITIYGGAKPAKGRALFAK